MIELLVDTREQDPLVFSAVSGIVIKQEYLATGDYAARHQDGTMDMAIIERKSVADLFSSFTGNNYDREKDKIARAKEAGQRYILAIERPVSEVLKGYHYRKNGEWIESKKSGIGQVRQIMTLLRRGDFAEVWWCQSRTEMAFMIQEYYLAEARRRSKESE